MCDESIDASWFDLVKAGMGDAVPFARHVGVMLTDVGDGTASATLAAHDALNNHIGTVHAGALFTLAETASGAAMAGAFAPLLAEVRPVVSSANIDYVKPARAPLHATARLVVAGAELRRRLSTERTVTFDATVSIGDDASREVARFTATWVVRRRRPAAAAT